MVDIRRAGWCSLDRKHEHCPGRQQKIVSDERRNHSTRSDYEPHLRADGSRSRLAGHCKNFKKSFEDEIITNLGNYNQINCHLPTELRHKLVNKIMKKFNFLFCQRNGCSSGISFVFILVYHSALSDKLSVLYNIILDFLRCRVAAWSTWNLNLWDGVQFSNLGFTRCHLDSMKLIRSCSAKCLKDL